MANTDSKHSSPRPSRERDLLCDGLSFAAAEAYKHLRTNLLFTMPDKPGRILGITSSTRGEGKSTTAVNLSYTIAQTGNRVLLIDADLRLPSVNTKLGINRSPGLSNLLAGLCDESAAVRKSSLLSSWYILPSGDIPPNPSELLGSERMYSLLQKYAEVFDYIIIDLPPVNIVTDALVISKWSDGMLVTVRENYSERRALKECMYQIEKLGVKVLGFVVTGTSPEEDRERKYGKYGYRYGYKYNTKGGYGSSYGYRYGYRRGYAGSASDPKTDSAFMRAAADRSRGSASSGAISLDDD